MEIVLSMIETEFGFFDVEVEEPAGESPVLCQACLGVAPEGLDAVDVVGASGELVLAVVDSEVAFVADVDEPVIALPTVSMNNTLISHSALDNRFQSFSGAIFENIGVNFAAPLKQADNGNFTTRAPTSLPSDAACAKVAFIDFNAPFERCLPVAFLGDPDPDRLQMAVNAGPVDAHDLCDLDCLQIKRKEAVELPELVIGKSGTFEVSVGH